ncbi:YceI family protein [Nonomuraea sp. NPDC048892]|uniref:YceI family protein n=1 Tax=Nonomuraea sp. NPDC048892 TaxID=3154624 RepID=UPI0033D0C443
MVERRTGSPVPAGRESSPRVGDYRIDPDRSTIRFRTRALFGVLPVRGTFTIGEGVISVRSPLDDSVVVVEVPAGSFASGLRIRDRHVRAADFLDVDTHPTMFFRGGPPGQAGASTVLHGNLTVRGVSQPLSLVLGSATSNDTLLMAGATVTIDRYAFGLTKGRGMAARHLRIAIEVVATRIT